MVGGKNALTISRNLHVASSIFLLAAGLEGQFHLLYFIGWLMYTGLLIYQQLLVKPNDLSKVNLAFFTTNGIASILFASTTLIDLYFYGTTV